MELAGFSVAQAITKEYKKEEYNKILICAGNPLYLFNCPSYPKLLMLIVIYP